MKKTAIVTDWLLSEIGGGEKVVKAIYELYDSPIFTLISDPKKLKNTFFKDCLVHTSFIQNLPFAKKKYRSYLPFFPLAIEQFDLSDFEVIFSCSHCVAKGVLTHAGQVHICYCHTPLRYAWDLTHEYLKESNFGFLKNMFARVILHYLRGWDLYSSARVDYFIANSHYVAKRIQKTYQRNASVIYPPVDTTFFLCKKKKKEDFYLTISRMVPYKKIDLIVEAFGYMPEKKLVVIGDGPDRKKIKAKAKANVYILKEQPDDVLKEYLQKAKAFVFAAVEDFGIVPVEAQSCGTPVIALAKGGVLETVIDQKTGLFFHEQNVKSLIEAVQTFEKTQDQFDHETISQHAKKFDTNRFKKEMKQFIYKVLENDRNYSSGR